MKLLSLIIMMIFSHLAFTQNPTTKARPKQNQNQVQRQTPKFEYELRGSYKLDSSRKKPIYYTLRWNEDNGEIKGIYSDNFFSKNAEVSGTGTSLGRTFNVRFPQVKMGIRSVTVLSSVAQNRDATTIPVSIVTRDIRGNPLTTTKVEAGLNILKETTVAQLQEEPDCLEGFGLLGGYCGVYAGLVAEDTDRRNRCNLLLADAVRLEMTQEGSILLHLAPVSDLVQTPAHSIGRIPYNPADRSVDLLGRVCGPLAGVNSSSTTCKRLHLEGDFFVEDDRRHFTGTYTITEEDTNLLCRYTLSMDQEL